MGGFEWSGREKVYGFRETCVVNYQARTSPEILPRGSLNFFMNIRPKVPQSRTDD